MNNFYAQTSHYIDNGSLPYMNTAKSRREIRREAQSEMQKETKSVSNDEKITQTNINTDRYSQMESHTIKTPSVNEANDPNADERRKSKSVKLEIYYDKILGEGSFAKVYVAKYKGKLVAVKIVDVENAKEKLIKQFKRELDIIRILRNNPHPNIPQYYKIIEERRIIGLLLLWNGVEVVNLQTLSNPVSIMFRSNTISVRSYRDISIF